MRPPEARGLRDEGLSNAFVKQRFSVEQISSILIQAELGTPIKEPCRKHGVSQQIFYRWKKVYGGFLPREARELKQLRK